MEIDHENRASGEMPDGTPGISWPERTFTSTTFAVQANPTESRPLDKGKRHGTGRWSRLTSSRPGRTALLSDWRAMRRAPDPRGSPC